MATKRGRGRPPVPESERLSNFVVRLTPIQRAYVEWRGIQDDTTASDVVRRLIDLAIDGERPLVMGETREGDEGFAIPTGVAPGETYSVRRLLGWLSLVDWDHPLPDEEQES